MTLTQHCFSAPQRSLWKCPTSSFHLRKILSDWLSPLFLSWGAVCTGPCFIWISKPVRRWPDTLNAIFLGVSRGMWLLKCSWRRDLITETMLPLWWWGDSNLYLSPLCFVDYTIAEEDRLHLSLQLFQSPQFRWHLRKCSHLLPRTQEPWLWTSYTMGSFLLNKMVFLSDFVGSIFGYCCTNCTNDNNNNDDKP